MKSLLTLAALSLALSGCAEWTGISPGNPDGTAYAGSPGSVYSTADNPPKTIGTVSYVPPVEPPTPYIPPLPGAALRPPALPHS